jgi:hypothetical protein
MRPEELLQLIRRQPFVPLRIHATDGTIYSINHPDQVIVLRGSLDVGVGAANGEGPSERVERLSLIHVIRVEEAEAARPSSNNGA